MFPWQLLLWKWVKEIFTVIIVTVARRRRYFTGYFHAKSSRACHPYLMDFLEIFTSDRYHRDMKILKTLVSNSKRFRVYGIFNKWQIDDDRGGAQILHFLWQFLLKIISGLKNSAGCFLTQETQEWYHNCPKTYWH